MLSCLAIELGLPITELGILGCLVSPDPELPEGSTPLLEFPAAVEKRSCHTPG